MAGPDPSRLNSTAASSAPARDEPLELCGYARTDLAAPGRRRCSRAWLARRWAEGARRIPRGVSGALATRSRRFPRKEVIQPQLPLRLPCYDFTPIADPTFDGCLLAG